MRRAQRRKYHYFYKTTCIITGKYYYGMHSTDNLDDGYIGSGKRLWYSIHKHGIENHVCEKLEFFETREKLVQKEAGFINENLIKDPLCMNLRIGGSGGFSKKDSMKGNFKRIENFKRRLKEDILFYETYCEKLRKSRIGKKATEKTKKILSIKNSGINNPMFGKNHSEKTIGKMQKAKSENNNLSFGTCWIYNLELKKCRKIKKEEINFWLNNNWYKGRKIF